MLFRLDPLSLIYLAIAFVVVITIHEASHAFVAWRLGDPTAKSLGRISLNPLVHLDPMGTILIFLASFGWGKPVPVDPRYLKPNPKTGMALVSLAGPLSNVVLAFLLYLPIRLGADSFTGVPEVDRLFITIISISLLLAAFNLLPLPPLDGFSVLLGLLPYSAARQFAQLERYGLGPVFLLIFADSFFRLGILASILGPIQDALASVVTGEFL
ncbi:MAG: site-2 protease family protein [Chloroflexota bacterium]